MTQQLGNEALDHLLANAGLELTEAQKSDLRTVIPALNAMKARVRRPRGRMAELAHTYGFIAEDLA